MNHSQSTTETVTSKLFDLSMFDEGPFPNTIWGDVVNADGEKKAWYEIRDGAEVLVTQSHIIAESRILSRKTLRVYESKKYGTTKVKEEK